MSYHSQIFITEGSTLPKLFFQVKSTRISCDPKTLGFEFYVELYRWTAFALMLNVWCFMPKASECLEQGKLIAGHSNILSRSLLLLSLETCKYWGTSQALFLSMWAPGAMPQQKQPQDVTKFGLRQQGGIYCLPLDIHWMPSHSPVKVGLCNWWKPEKADCQFHLS